MTILEIIPPKPFDFSFTLDFLNRSPHELMHICDGDSVIKAIDLNGKKVPIKISESNGKLLVSTFSKLLKEEEIIVREYVEEWFDLKTDLAPFYKLAKKDDILKDLIKRFHGYRIVSIPDLFESLVWAVIGQQINVDFAYIVKQRYVKAYGEQVTWNDRSIYLFPTPEVTMNIPDEELLAIQFSRQKARYVKLIAEAFAQGVLSKEKIAPLTLEEAKKELTKIKGIGNWTANYAMMKTFRRPDAFPLEDVALHNAIRILKGMKKKPSLQTVKRIFKNYKGWEAYATLYLWKSL
jgi:DNA-3-methyladenine glycosylase II